MRTRSLNGIVKPKSYLTTKYPLSIALISPELKSTATALKHPQWLKSMQHELTALKKAERLKSRLGAKRYLQTPGIDHEETLSPDVKPATMTERALEAMPCSLVGTWYLGLQRNRMWWLGPSLKGDPVASTCPLCLKGPETSLHALWGCDKLSSICENIFLHLQVPNFLYWDIYEFLYTCLGGVSIALFEKFIICLWRIWYRQNKWENEKSCVNDDLLFDWCMEYLRRYSSANKHTPRLANLLESQPVVRWSKPSFEFMKINYDAALNFELGKSGVGVVFRDDTGFFLTTGSWT
uniref:Reverse transcriptase zinc-binding domain-containing protein n=1 Tax=Cannabis sativa TaxID=3483 RepID=A0A803PEN7_CANSA